MGKTVYPTRIWCTLDAKARELTVVQDGAAGIRVATIPFDWHQADPIALRRVA